MAEKSRYPQIPTTVWWGVRSILQKSPGTTVDERLLSVQLQVQEAAARQYIAELKGAGILNEEGKPTPIALKWRVDDTYSEAVDELVAAVYPESLRHVAPPGDDMDRQKIVSWFLREGLGQGAAGNKAATYLLISSKQPNEAPGRGGARKPKEASARRLMGSRSDKNSIVPQGEPARPEKTEHRRQLEIMPLNINVQIHISADANSEQIELIFSAMRRYLYDTQSP